MFLFRWLRSLLGPIPRTRPKGSDPLLCDGCDASLRRLDWFVLDGGYYCPKCAEEVSA